MPGKIPRRPSGNSPEAEFAKWQYDNQVNESKLALVSGQRTANTTAGKVVIAGGGRRRGGGGVGAVEFKLRFVENDYLVCREWDGTNLGATDVYVLKPPALRRSLASKEIYGDTYTFTYEPDPSEPFMEFGEAVEEETFNIWGEEPEDYESGGNLFEKRLNVRRTVDQDGFQEIQRVTPFWCKGDIIYGIEFDGGVTTEGIITDAGQSIEYLLIGEMRMWGRI